jgi:hypothetical protein
MANATQPGSQKVYAYGPDGWYGSVPFDDNRAPVNGHNYFQTQDATAGTNVVSPVAATTAVTTLVIPQNAVSVTLISDGIFKVSEQASMSQYATIPVGTPITLDVARQLNLYIAAATTANVSFIFNTL